MLLFGGPKVGKTKAVLDIARHLGPDDTMFIIDSDNAFDRMLEGPSGEGLGVREEYRGGVRDKEWEDDDGQLVVWHTKNWKEHKDALGKAFDRAGRNDWVVVDSMTHLWDDIQEDYIRETWGVDLPEFLHAHRKKEVAKDGKATPAAAMLVEWSYLNPQWNRTVATPVTEAGCHVLLIAEAKDVRTDGKDDRATKILYGDVGVKPSCQKRLGHQVQTVLVLESKRNSYRFTTVGDRERDKVTDVEWGDEDFARKYLWDIAGWRPRKTD